MRYVLFVCNHNAGRSQMAQAFFQRDAPADMRAESAGSDPAPRLWPTVVQAMAEVGIDLSGRRPARLLLETQLHADCAVTMGCGDACPYVPTTVEAWEVPDPAHEPIERVREIRDEIQRRVRQLIDTRLDDIRCDRTAHELRLGKLLPHLVGSSKLRARPRTFARAPTRSSTSTTRRRCAASSSRSWSAGRARACAPMSASPPWCRRRR